MAATIQSQLTPSVNFVEMESLCLMLPQFLDRTLASNMNSTQVFTITVQSIEPCTLKLAAPHQHQPQRVRPLYSWLIRLPFSVFLSQDLLFKYKGYQAAVIRRLKMAENHMRLNRQKLSLEVTRWKYLSKLPDLVVL